jgi:hypothetical protein
MSSTIMQEKTTNNNLRRLRKYIANESERLGKCGEGIVHCVNLDDVDDDPRPVNTNGSKDTLERDLDLLFNNNRKQRKQ